jgi:DNA-binding response OmpR family regulator
VAFHQLAATLESEGYLVEGARDGEEALHLIAADPPALITLDLVLPGLDGWEVLRELKTSDRTSRIPVVIVTRRDSREVCLALGADDFFLKPVDRDLFLDRAKHILEPEAGSDRPPRVLVIDDDPALHELLRIHLEDAGFEVLEALDGATGVAAAVEKKPDLVVLDLLMPGMSGFEVAHALRANQATRQTPIIVLTAKEVTAEDRSALADTIQGLMCKGAESYRRLGKAIRDLLARR